MAQPPLTRHVRVDRVVVSQHNPRPAPTDEQVAELAASIALHGVLQPVIVRRVPKGHRDHFELVAGQRRLAAARKAGLDEIPAAVLELDDAGAIDVALVENLQRDDLSFWDEAHAIGMLHDDRKLSVDEIATRLGKSKGYVYARIKLGDLKPAVREAAQKGNLPGSHALLIARLPGNLQGDALECARIKRWGVRTGGAAEQSLDAWIDYRSFQRVLRDEVLLTLDRAPWDLTDADLLKKAGACAACPERSGAPGGLFGDVDATEATCFDLACYRKKLQAAFEIRAAAHTEAGGKVLPKLGSSDRASNDSGTLRRLDDQCHDAGWSPKRTWRQVIKPRKKTDPEAPLILARDRVGFPVELVEHKDALEAARANGYKWAKPRSGAARTVPHRERVAKHRSKVEARAAKIAATLAVERLFAKLLPMFPAKMSPRAALVARTLLVSESGYLTDEWERRLLELALDRKPPAKRAKPRRQTTKRTDEIKDAELLKADPRRALVAVLVNALNPTTVLYASRRKQQYNAALHALAGAVGIDAKAIDKDAKAAAGVELPAPKRKAAKRKTKRATKRKTASRTKWKATKRKAAKRKTKRRAAK